MDPSLAFKRISRLNLTEIKKLLEGVEPDEALIAKLKRDRRAGVRNLACSFRKELDHIDRLENHHNEMLTFERELRKNGKTLIAGVDEAGCGPWAGPVSIGCVIFPDGIHLPGLDDSKKMTKPHREEMYDRIIETALAWSVTLIDHIEIDEFGIHAASLRGMTKVVGMLSLTPEFVLVDGRAMPSLSCPGSCIIDGDALSLTIAAASVLAKVTRDKIMVEMDALYPGYGFKNHKGYSCKSHLEAVRKLGPCDIHRTSFEVVSAVSPPGTVRAVLEKRIMDASSPEILESVAKGIARNGRFVSESDLEFLRGVYQEKKTEVRSRETE
jgi:ribonuclease HII